MATRYKNGVIFRRQLSTMVSGHDYLLVQKEAARRKMTLVALVGEWIEPHLKKLRESTNAPDPEEDDGGRPE